MLTGLQGLVLKSKKGEEGKTAYTIILGKRLILPWMYKTATLYKDWENDSSNLRIFINKMDSIRYRKGIKNRDFTELNYEELIELNKEIEKLPEDKKDDLRRSIENIPEKIKKTVYKTINEEIFPKPERSLSYGFEMQKINEINQSKLERPNLESLSKKLSEKVYNKLYKKVFSTNHNFLL